MSSEYKYLFGPVPSRRLGMSLGVDLIPHKICTLNCVYCECGRSTTITLERKAYVPEEEVLMELTDFFNYNPDPEYITFSGAGEPTLHSQIGQVIGFIKNLRPGIPVAVLTNGSLLGDPQVRSELMAADLVLPSLDAAHEEAFRKINRPVADFSLDGYIRGLADFRREFEGEVWLEVLILPGYNDDPDNLDALKEAILEINPHRVQLNTLDRPGAVEGLKAASRDELERIAARWGLDQVEIVAPPANRQDAKHFRNDMEKAILETISRRPCTLGDLEKIMGLKASEIKRYLGDLESSGSIETSRQERGIFYHRSGKE